jgi:hypothetical protein
MDSSVKEIRLFSSERLAKEAVFDALWNRRVYGTSSQRIFLGCSLSGHSMGSIIRQQENLKRSAKALSEVPRMPSGD